MLPPAALAASSLAAGPSVLQPRPGLLSAEEETARRFDSSKCRRMLERVHASGWANVCGFSRAGLDLGQHTFRAQPQQGRDVYYVRNEKVASTFLTQLDRLEGEERASVISQMVKIRPDLLDRYTSIPLTMADIVEVRIIDRF